MTATFEFSATCVFAVGSVLTTLPSGTSVLASRVNCGESPAPSSVVRACASVFPTTEGTATVSGAVSHGRKYSSRAVTTAASARPSSTNSQMGRLRRSSSASATTGWEPVATACAGICPVPG